MSGTLYTTYIANLKNCNTSDATVLVVTRYLKPELFNSLKSEYNIVHTPELSPSSYLLQDWRDNKISWRQYTTEFIRQIIMNRRAMKFIERIMDILDSGKDVYLVCYENLAKSDSHCHRVILSSIISAHGYYSEELMP